jgi:hypothetical protein
MVSLENDHTLCYDQITFPGRDTTPAAHGLMNVMLAALSVTMAEFV